MTSGDTLHRQFDRFAVTAVASTRRHGDLHPLRTEHQALHRRQTDLFDGRVAMLDQRHGRDVVQVGEDSSWPVAGVGDVIVSRSGGPVGVWTADCAPLLLFGSAGSVVGVHAGWRGLAGGVIDTGVDATLVQDQRVVYAVLGPTIRPCCYEFDAVDLVEVAAGVHASTDRVSGVTTSGTLALDVPAAVFAALARRGITPEVIGGCTGCDDARFSHRVRTDAGRHALVGRVDRVHRAGVRAAS